MVSSWTEFDVGTQERNKSLDKYSEIQEFVCYSTPVHCRNTCRKHLKAGITVHYG